MWDHNSEKLFSKFLKTCLPLTDLNLNAPEIFKDILYYYSIMNEIDPFFCDIFGKWPTEKIFNKTNKNNDKTNEKYRMFINACKYGNLNLAKKIYFSEGIDLHECEWEYEENVFLSACCEGKLKVAQWLYSLGGFEDDINSAFNIVCDYGYLNIAKWLYSLGNIDIHAEEDEAFINSCISDHPKVSKWLSSIEDNYYVIIENNKLVKWGFKNPV